MRTAIVLVALLATCASALASYTPIDPQLTKLSLLQTASAAKAEPTIREAQYLRATSPGFSGQVFSCSRERQVFSTARLREIKGCD